MHYKSYRSKMIIAGTCAVYSDTININTFPGELIARKAVKNFCDKYLVEKCFLINQTSAEGVAIGHGLVADFSWWSEKNNEFCMDVVIYPAES